MSQGRTESALPCFTTKDVAHHCEVNSCWIIISDLVYDVTAFIREHPGGEDIMLEHAGADATTAFFDKGHSQDAVEMLREYLVGQLVKEEMRAPNRPVGAT